MQVETNFGKESFSFTQRFNEVSCFVSFGNLGESLATQPRGGVWNNVKRSIRWCVEKLGQGEKFQLQAQFQMTDIAENLDEQPVFPILIRCQCLYSQLSQIELDAGEASTAFPVDLSVKLARRFRLSHKEK